MWRRKRLSRESGEEPDNSRGPTSGKRNCRHAQEKVSGDQGLGTAGRVIISYTLGTTGCTQVAAVVVNPVSPILGTPVVCVGQATALTDTTLGGTWSSSNPAAGTVSTAGIVTGISAGTTVISYSLGTGCAATMTVTVNGLPPAITGCLYAAERAALADPAPGGIWNSGDVAIATVGQTVQCMV